MPSESFSWGKFMGGLTTVVGWAKFASFWLRVAMVAVPLVTGYFAYTAVYNKGYVRGQAVMHDIKDAEFKKWIAEHPQQTISGSTVNNNVTKANNKFGISIFPLRLGWCE